MNLANLLKKQIILFDGGIGSNLAEARKQPQYRDIYDNLTCSEAYNLYAPGAVLDIQAAYVKAGCDLLETNTFNANRLSLAEYDLQEKVREITLAAVKIAKEAASRSDKKVYVAGDLGPTNKLPSLGQTTFDELHQAYTEEVDALIEGGVDLIVIDTCQDILQTKAAVIACKDKFKKIGKPLPIVVSVTIDQTGKLLLGTEPNAVIATLVSLGVDAIGLNCGVGPKGMEEAARYLAHHSPLPVLLMPNAGLPEIVNGETKYNLGPEAFAELVAYFVTELGVEMVGGCCGTTPAHIAELAKKIKGLTPKEREINFEPGVSSLFSAIPVKQKPAPFIIGERMNINGSKKFKKFILEDDHEGAAGLIAEQEESGVHALDISVAYVGRDEKKDFEKMLKCTVGRAKVPICVDSTNVDVMEAALKMIPGRPIINSINLEDGGEKARKVLELASRFGAAIIALTIDEEGMAKDAGDKFEITKRIVTLCAEFEIKEEDIFIDPLTFTLAEPRAAAYGSGKKTLEAIRDIKKRYPKINIVLGVSNISYGFKKSARRVLNSVFLHEAVHAGLDAAIVHAGQIMPISGLEKEMATLSLDLIWNKKEDAQEKFVKFFEGKTLEFDEVAADILPKEGARLCILRGDKAKMTGFIEALVKEMKPKEVLNTILLPAMGEVGRLFDAAEIPLPYVLQSAEAMRAATDVLAKYFKKGDNVSKGKVLLATVRGDVHDIGKNLVDIVFSNNGFEVINLGVKQPVGNIIKAAEDYGVDAIGLSGLLVESALIMKDDLAEMAHKGIKIPVICGGAALTRRYVEKDLSAAYGNPVHYAADAFDGLRVVKGLLAKGEVE